MLEQRLEAIVEVQGEPRTSFSGAEYHEAVLVSEDGQTLHLYPGQLKEIPGDPVLEPGRRYRVVFRPFINNRWVELKLESLEPVEGS